VSTRDKVLIAIVLLILFVVAPIMEGIDPNSPPNVAKHQFTPNTSSDGRYHTCGVITEDGVTEYLNAYKERCHPVVEGPE
jgi:hypothetical protein